MGTIKTKQEIREYKKNWRIKKHNTTKQTLVKSTTWKGRKAEYLAKKVLLGSIDNNSDGMNKSFDLKWEGLKIDVKSCNLYKRKTHHGKSVDLKNISGWWVFNKNKGYSDKYFCIAMIENIPVRYYLIPKEDFNNGITIGQKSNKFDKYLINKTI